MTMGKTKFKWSNYTKLNTPANVVRWSGALQGLLAGASALTSFMETNKWVPIITALLIIVVNQVAQFAGSVKQELEAATAVFPSGDEVTLVKEVPDEVDK